MCHSTTPHPCPWVPRAAEGAQFFAHHRHRKIGRWARSTESSRQVHTPTKGMSPASHLVHHCHEGVGNRIVWGGAGFRGCGASPGSSALWLPVTKPRPPNNLSARSVHVTHVCPSPSRSGLTAALPSPHWYEIHVPRRPGAAVRELSLSMTATPTHAGALASCIGSGHSEQ